MNEFGIRHPTNLAFDFGDTLPADVPADELASLGQLGLGKLLGAPEFSDSGPDDISWSSHVPKSVLDCRTPLSFALYWIRYKSCQTQARPFRGLEERTVNLVPYEKKWQQKRSLAVQSDWKRLIR
jgi:hypothetical protein